MKGHGEHLGLAKAAILVAALFAATNAFAGEDGWTGEVSASLTAQTGTTDSFAGSIDAKTDRTWERDAVEARFTGVYGTTKTRNNLSQTSSNVTQNSQGLFLEWQRTIHERFFWDTNAEVSRDNVQDREVRAAIGTGPGYRFWEGEEAPKEHFDVSGGIGYRYELYDGNTRVFTPGPTPPAGQPVNTGDEDHFVDLILSFEYKNMLIEDRLEFTHTGRAKMPANSPGQYILSTEVIVGVPITEAWSFRLGFLAEYQAEQPEEINNTTTRTTVGLGYKF